MKKVSILSLHLGYGGIEKSIVALANILVEKYQVEIACIYKLQKKEAFELDKRVKVKYLIKNDIAKRVENYKVLLSKKQFKKLFSKLWEDYFKKLRFISFLKDTFSSFFTYFNRSIVMKK